MCLADSQKQPWVGHLVKSSGKLRHRPCYPALSKRDSHPGAPTLPRDTGCAGRGDEWAELADTDLKSKQGQVGFALGRPHCCGQEPGKPCRRAGWGGGWDLA